MGAPVTSVAEQFAAVNDSSNSLVLMSGSAVGSVVTTSDKLKRHGQARQRLHWVYFLLAAFDVLAVCAGLSLSHMILRIYLESVGVNQQWVDRAGQLGVIAEHAQAVNAPGNDVFHSKDVNSEKVLRDAALVRFNAHLAEFRIALPPQGMDALIDILDAVEQSMVSMVAESEEIFRLFAASQPDHAAERMAAMDRKYAALTKELASAQNNVRIIQTQNFKKQTAAAAQLGKYESAIAICLLVMVLLVVLYGRRVGNMIRAVDGEMQTHARELRAAHVEVTNLNSELANSITKLREVQEEGIRKGKLAQLGQLTATVAHEIRNPLGAIRTATYLVERKIKGKELGIESQLVRITNGIRRCDLIITELLDFARSGTLQLKTVKVDEWLGDVLKEEAKAIPKSVQVISNPGLESMSATFDCDRMRRVIINLLTNASEAMVNKGTETAVIAGPQPTITISTAMAAGCIRISVEDNGPGISSENMERILEPLFTTKSFGVGLGLPAVQKILEQHGGSLEISSTLGNGASVTAIFPIAQICREAA